MPGVKGAEGDCIAAAPLNTFFPLLSPSNNG